MLVNMMPPAVVPPALSPGRCPPAVVSPGRDSDLRHRLLQWKLSIRARYPPKAPSCQALSYTSYLVVSRYFPTLFVINDE